MRVCAKKRVKEYTERRVRTHENNISVIVSGNGDGRDENNEVFMITKADIVHQPRAIMIIFSHTYVHRNRMFSTQWTTSLQR